MAQELDEFGTARLQRYLNRLGTHLKDHRKRESLAIHAFGILGESARKSADPTAALTCPNPEFPKKRHDKLLHFVAHSEWSDEQVRLEATRYICEVLAEQEPVTTWVIDDTGFLKQGIHSVGMQRQYTGSAGKITNSQIGVSLEIATATQHAPIDFELYLPESWTNDPSRCEQARIPSDVQFKTKVELALGMIERAARAKVPGQVILADSAYGESPEFCATV